MTRRRSRASPGGRLDNGEATPEQWESLRELEDISTRMRRLLDESLGGELSTRLGERIWSPLVDVEETEDAYVLEAELPGVKEDDIAIELLDNQLVISGEVKERERTGILRRRARRTGRFEYRVSLLGEFDADRIEANLAEGVLTVRVPKGERAKRRRIEVQTS